MNINILSWEKRAKLSSHKYDIYQRFRYFLPLLCQFTYHSLNGNANLPVCLNLTSPLKVKPKNLNRNNSIFLPCIWMLRGFSKDLYPYVYFWSIFFFSAMVMVMGVWVGWTPRPHWLYLQRANFEIANKNNLEKVTTNIIGWPGEFYKL